MEERARPRTLRRVATETRRDRQVCDASRRKQGAIARFATRRDRNKAGPPGLRHVATETSPPHLHSGTKFFDPNALTLLNIVPVAAPFRQNFLLSTGDCRAL